ncbi:MAG: TetR/AcrR family transcriptional regulator [Acidobacteriota bacterium]
MDARRLAILRAAGRAFRRSGFAAAGMRDIAAEADLSPGNLYHYFKGKDEILFFCQDQFLDRMLAVLDRARREGGPVEERLRQVLIAHVLGILDEVNGTAAHLEVDGLPEPLRTRLVAKRDRYETGIRRLVAAGRREGAFRRVNARLVTRAMLGALNWTVRWFHPEGRDPARTVAAGVADFLLAGLAAPAGTRVPER